MFTHNINPVLASLGPFEIRYYGIFFVLSFIIAYFLLNYLAKRKKINLTKDDVSDLLVRTIIGIILGARLAYVFVYNPTFYLQNPYEIIAIWHGGLSFHGGLIGAAIAG